MHGASCRYACDPNHQTAEPHNHKTFFAYRYGYLDKVMSVADNGSTYTYEYHADGQLARASYGHANANRGTVGRDDPIAPQSETFLWDGLALIQRGDEQFINEPHVGNAPQKLCFEGEPQAKRRARRARKGPRGNPVASSKGTSYFNDALGTTIGSKSNGKYSPAVLSAFGESLETLQCEATSNFKHQTSNSQTFFTGKPMVEGLGHAFWMRNYRAGLAKWQTADPMGYPDGWNQLAYCGNGVIGRVDIAGGKWSELHFIAYYLRLSPLNLIDYHLFADFVDFVLGTDVIDSDVTGYTHDIWVIIHDIVMLRVWMQIDELVVSSIKASNLSEGSGSGSYDTLNTYSFVQAFWVFGGAEVSTVSTYTYNWETVQEGNMSHISYSWESVSSVNFKDDFHDPASFGEAFGRMFENDLWVGERYLITHQWEGIKHKWQHVIE